MKTRLILRKPVQGFIFGSALTFFQHILEHGFARLHLGQQFLRPGIYVSAPSVASAPKPLHATILLIPTVKTLH